MQQSLPTHCLKESMGIILSQRQDQFIGCVRKMELSGVRRGSGLVPERDRLVSSRTPARRIMALIVTMIVMVPTPEGRRRLFCAR